MRKNPNHFTQRTKDDIEVSLSENLKMFPGRTGKGSWVQFELLESSRDPVGNQTPVFVACQVMTDSAQSTSDK